jgi:hypothetical protein
MGMARFAEVAELALRRRKLSPGPPAARLKLGSEIDAQLA